MSGICDTCKREPCSMRFDGCKTCDVYEGGESNYERLFGTSERAARAVVDRYLACNAYGCSCCPLERCCPEEGGYDELLECLRGDA